MAVLSVRSVRRPLGSIVAAVLLTLGLAGTTALVAPTAAFADSSYSMESQFVAKMNASRQAAGLRPYAVAGDLTSVARSHSQQMASKQSLYHNPSLTSDVSNWRAVGENVGDGPTVDDLHTAFMNSPEHRANILDHDFTQVGVGVTVDKDGVIWVTEDFRQPMSTPTTSAPSSSSSGHTSTSPAPAPATYSSGGTAPLARPTPTLSPRAKLLHRLHEIRQHQHARRHAADPVAQAFDYVETLASLTG